MEWSQFFIRHDNIWHTIILLLSCIHSPMSRVHSLEVSSGCHEACPDLSNEGGIFHQVHSHGNSQYIWWKILLLQQDWFTCCRWSGSNGHGGTRGDIWLHDRLIIFKLLLTKELKEFWSGTIPNVQSAMFYVCSSVTLTFNIMKVILTCDLKRVIWYKISLIGRGSDNCSMS